MAHHETLKQTFPDIHPRGVELTYLRKTSGAQEWERLWNFPEKGLSLSYYDLGDPRLGHSFIFTAFLQKYFGDPADRLQWSIRIAPGLSYSSIHYDSLDNPANTFISSAINGVMEGSLDAHYRLTAHWTVNAGIGITHYSNGAIKLPNAGYNIPSVHIGTIYTPHPDRYQPEAGTISTIHKRWSFPVMYAGSVKSMDKETNELSYAWTVSGYAHYLLNHKSALTLGMDIFNNPTIPDRVDDPEASVYRVGIHVGHDLMVGPTSVLFQVGYYMYRPVPVDESWYWRLGFKHDISRHLFAGVFLKAHMGRADVIEWGLGYAL